MVVKKYSFLALSLTSFQRQNNLKFTNANNSLKMNSFGFLVTFSFFLLNCAALKLILQSNQNDENQMIRSVPKLLQAPDVLGTYALDSCTFKKGRLEGQTVNAGTIKLSNLNLSAFKKNFLKFIY